MGARLRLRLLAKETRLTGHSAPMESVLAWLINCSLEVDGPLEVLTSRKIGDMGEISQVVVDFDSECPAARIWEIGSKDFPSNSTGP